MSTQITVRLPDALVEGMDQQVQQGRAKSRASIVEQALRAELDRQRDERDAEIYRRLRAELLDDAPRARWSQENAADVLSHLD